MASSGYQSFAYSQSSSPVDPTINCNGQEVGSTSSGHSSSGGSSSFRPQQATVSSPSVGSTTVIHNNINNNNNINGPTPTSPSSAAIAFTNPIYNLRSNKATTPLPSRSYASAYGYESVLNRTPSSDDVHHKVASTAARVTLISSNGNHSSSNSPNNNSLSSGTMSRPRMSSSSSDSATPPHERRLFISTAPRTNPRCVYPSPVISPQQQLLQPRHSPVDNGSTSVNGSMTESQYAAVMRRKGRKSSVSSTQTPRSRIYDSSSSDSDFEQAMLMPSTRFRERNMKRGSRNALDRCSNPKSLDEVRFV